MTLSTHLDIWSPPPALPRAFFLEAPLEVVRALLDAPYPFVENEIHIHLPKKIKKVSAPARPLTQPVTHPFSPTRAARRAARAAVGDGVVLPTPGPQTPPLAGLQGAGADQFARPTPRRPPPRLSPPLGGGDRAPACGPDVFFCGPQSEPGPGRAGAHFRPGLRSTLKPPCLRRWRT